MTSRSYFGMMNSTLGSVVPLAMFEHGFDTPPPFEQKNCKIGKDAAAYMLCFQLIMVAAPLCNSYLLCLMYTWCRV